MAEHAPITLEKLFGFLPDLDEVEELRLSMVGAAVRDPQREWESFQRYATIDKRIVSLDRAEEVIGDAEAALHEYVSHLIAVFRLLFRSLWAGELADAANYLIRLGEHLERKGRYRKARECFQTALEVSLPLADKAPQVLALRRIARVGLALGELNEALSYYQRSCELARDAGEVRAQAIALTGCGNVLAVQGRWAAAERPYREALDILEQQGHDDCRVERAQLYNNLGMVASRQNRLAEAEAWFDRALAVWAVEPSPADLAICYHSQAVLREKQGRREEARSVLRRALTLDAPPAARATIAMELAESYLAEGNVSAAERWGREAEEHAIAARSPYYLAHIYRGLGNIAGARGDDAFIFFEKALEIARAKQYPLVEGETLMDYALLRARMGEQEEAQAYLEHARRIFVALGAAHEQAKAEERLERLCSPAVPLSAR